MNTTVFKLWTGMFNYMSKLTCVQNNVALNVGLMHVEAVQKKSIIITLYERIKIPYRKNSYKHNNIIYTINLQDFLHTSKKVLRSLKMNYKCE